MKNFLTAEEIFDKKLHKIYLILALSIGLIFSVSMPLFNEPDGQFHYTASTNIAGLSNDLSAYGETEIGSGITQQLPHYQNGNYFETYFENQIKRMPVENLPRLNFIPKSGYNYWGHLIPALGVWVGHTIYPSIGVMVVVARILSTCINAFLMFLIIRWVKAGKLLFFAISLSPTMINSFASLTYDSLTYILVAFTISSAINIIVRKRVVLPDFIWLVISTVTLWYGAKTNAKVLIVLIPVVMLAIFIASRNSERKDEESEVRYRRYKRLPHKFRKFFIVLVIMIGLIVIAMGVYAFKPTIVYSIYRIIISHLLYVTPGLTVNSIFQSTLASPYPSINNIPLWVSGVWWILILLVLLVEKKYVNSSIISWLAFLLFFAGFGAVYYSFTTFLGGADNVNVNRAIGAIVGVQGRYFTPTLLLFSIFTGYEKFSIKWDAHRLVTKIAIVVIILSNAMLLFGTFFGIYYLS